MMEQDSANRLHPASSQHEFFELSNSGHLGSPVDPRYRRSARLGILWDNRRSLWKAAICGAALAALAAFLSPSRFAATARLMPPNMPGAQDFAILRLVDALAGYAPTRESALDEQFLSLSRRGGLFVAILSSRTVQDNIIREFDLRTVYGSHTSDETRKQLSRRTNISLDRKNNILTIEVTDHEPQRAMAIVQEYVRQLNKFIADSNTFAASRERAFLAQRLDQITTELETAENNLSQFSSRNSAIDLNEQARIKIKEHAALQGQLIAEQTEFEGLRQVYTDNNIRVQTTRSRLAELKNQIARMEGRPGKDTLDEMGEVEPDKSLRQLPLLNPTYAALYRRVSVDETVLIALTQKYELAKAQEAREIPSVKVLDAPEFPEKRVFPQRILMIAIGFCLGFLFCVVWVFLHTDWTHLDSQDPGKLLAGEIYSALKSGLAVSSRMNGY
jgi:uncharacterized protein involved in exopolysaccharide biosynthesis